MIFSNFVVFTRDILRFNCSETAEPIIAAGEVIVEAHTSHSMVEACSNLETMSVDAKDGG